MENYKKRRERLFICSFCGKNSNQVDCIVTGPDVYICNECVKSAGEIIKEDMSRRALVAKSKIRTPLEIKNELPSFIDKVTGIDGVERIIRKKEHPDNLMRLDLEIVKGHDPREEIFKLCAANNTVMLEMKRTETSLGDVFRQLTRKEPQA